MSQTSERSSSAWRGTRVLVTGADGFIGSHLVEALLDHGAEVIAFTRGTSTHGTSQLSLRRLGGVADRLAGVIAGNLGQPEVTGLIVEARPEVILHLGAEAYVPRSFTQPAEVFAVNANGTLYVLEAARRLKGLRRVVVTSSSEVYGTADGDRPISEDHPLRPTSPYAASKVAADRLAFAYRTTYELPVTIVRPFNTYGPRHVYDVIPKFISLALAGRELTVHGDGSQARDFTYVDDTVRGLLLAAAHPGAEGDVINLGSGRSYTILHAAQTIASLSGSASRIVHDAPRAAEVQLLLCDNRRAREQLGWSPQVEFEEGLRRNIEWEREHGG